MVQCPEIKTKLADRAMLGAGNQYRTKDSSAVAVFLADLEVHKRVERIFQLEQGCRDPNYLATMPIASSFLMGEGHAATLIKQISTDIMSGIQPMPSVEPVQAWSYKNAGLVAQQYTLAATSHELATCMMEGYDVRRAKEVLRVPDRYGIPIMVATGYEYEDPATFVPTPRLNMDEVVFGDTFGAPLDLTGDEQESSEDDVQVPETATS
jgi:nitroreductase